MWKVFLQAARTHFIDQLTLPKINFSETIYENPTPSPNTYW